MRAITKLPLAALLAAVFFLGLAAGGWKVGIASDVAERESDEYLRTYAATLDAVKENYVDELTGKDLIYASIKGMLKSLDPHSEFLTPDMYREMEEETKGEFDGIGIEMEIASGFPTVVETMEGTPASRAGLKAGDRIVNIDGAATAGMSLDRIVDLLRGRKGTAITLSVMRDGLTRPLELSMLRDVIQVKTVDSKMIDGEYGYVRIAEFQERTGEDLRTAVSALRKSSALKGILLDLRYNPGGLLDQAVDVADQFLSYGLITSIEGRKEDEKARFYARDADPYPGPLVVLVNEDTASAAEIVAGALQDRRRAIIVGTRTFGKGSVQSIFPLENGCAVRLTTSRYYTPNGRSIQAEGIHPDLVVEDDIERKKDGKPVPPDRTAKAEEDDDFQLAMGLQALKSWGALRGE